MIEFRDGKVALLRRISQPLDWMVALQNLLRSLFRDDWNRLFPKSDQYYILANRAIFLLLHLCQNL